LFFHLPDDRSAYAPGAFKVYVHGPIPQVLTHLLDGCAFPNSRAADKDVDAFEMFEGSVDESLSFKWVSYISLDGNSSRSPSLQSFDSSLCRCLVTKVVDDKIRAQLRQKFNDGPTDAARAACDYRHAPAQN
jgi:hypothetical protein